MKVAELLEIENLELVEPLFSDLVYMEMDGIFLEEKSDTGRILVDENENPAVFAIKTGDNYWKGCSTLYREPSLPLLDRFEELDFDIFQEDRNTIEECIREQFSLNLLKEVTPGADDLNPVRAENIREIIRKNFGNGSGDTCLDCCCGTGVGSMVIEDLGFYSLAYDNDESLLSQGMRSRRLKPQRTMWIDGREINRYISGTSQYACGFMFGEIHSFNRDIWKDITISLCEVAERVIITAGTQPEIDQIEGWISAIGKKTEVYEYDADPIYDRFVCYAE